MNSQLLSDPVLKYFELERSFKILVKTFLTQNDLKAMVVKNTKKTFFDPNFDTFLSVCLKIFTSWFRLNIELKNSQIFEHKFMGKHFEFMVKVGSLLKR